MSILIFSCSPRIDRNVRSCIIPKCKFMVHYNMYAFFSLNVELKKVASKINDLTLYNNIQNEKIFSN